MNTKRNTLIVLALVGAALAIGYGGYRAGSARGAAVGAQAAVAPPAKAERKVLYWHDPMSPTQKFDHPGKSPFMDMQLVPVYADADDAGAGGVSVSPRMQQSLGMRTAPVERGRLASGLSAVGTVAYNEGAVALVQARSGGFVERLIVRAALEPVRKGQVLAELFVPDWLAAQEEFLATLAMRGPGVDQLVAGARQRMRLVGMSEAQIDLVAAGGKVRARLPVLAPIAGVLSELSVREGMTVLAGAPMFRINGVDSVWVYAEVPEAAAAQIRTGTPAQVRAASLPDFVATGRVGAIVPDVNPTTRTLKARIELPNPGARLVPGMFTTIQFGAVDAREALLVPSEAVIQTGLRSIVMVAEAGRIVQTLVETGREAGGRTEIVKGLALGQQVLVSGQFLLDSEASLKGAAMRMDAAPGAAK